MEHFRTRALRAVGGWDAWNVTEDADLGFRLARFGYRIEVLHSATMEEAPERLDIWFRQRRRWTKGWMQTLLVLARSPRSVVSDLGGRQACAAGLMLVNLVVGPLAMPPIAAWLAWRTLVGSFDTPHGPMEIVAATVTTSVLVLGVGSTLWCGWLGARGRDKLSSLLAAALPYQFAIGLAAWGGLLDLVRQPHHWRKTPHGAAGRRKTTLRPVATARQGPYGSGAANQHVRATSPGLSWTTTTSTHPSSSSVPDRPATRPRSMPPARC